MVALTIAGTVATFNYIDDRTNNALSSYAKHRFETAADYITNGAWKKLIEKTNEHLKGKTIKGEPNLQFIDDILDKTKLQTDDNLIELWARLLANAFQGNSYVRKEYFDILEELNPYDVLVLNVAMSVQYASFYADCEKKVKGTLTWANMRGHLINFLNRSYNLDDLNENTLSSEHLKKLEVFRDISNDARFVLTPLGKGLRKALTT